MKSVLGLPGRNPETEGWMAALMAATGAEDTEVASYHHWQTAAEPDVALEAASYPVAGRKLVIAKSMGTMVLLKGAGEGDPGRAVLIGVPISAYSDDQIDALRAMAGRLPCLFIQQAQDFTGSATALQAVLGEGVSVTTIEGSDHVYADVEELAALIAAWQGALDG